MSKDNSQSKNYLKISSDPDYRTLIWNKDNFETDRPEDRKFTASELRKEIEQVSKETAFKMAEEKINRLHLSDLSLSENDKRIIQYGQLLTVLSSDKELIYFSTLLEQGKRINETSTMFLGL